MWQKKPINLSRNRGDQIFIQICWGDEMFRKSRQVWTEIVNRVYIGINNGGKKYKYGL